MTHRSGEARKVPRWLVGCGLGCAALTVLCVAAVTAVMVILASRLFLSTASATVSAVGRYLPPRVAMVLRVVLISTPNNGCKLADIAGRYLPFLKKIYKPLKSLEEKKFNELRLYSGKDIEVAAIAGSEPEMFLGRFLAEKNDGRVEVEEVKVKNLKDFLVLPLNHKEIHKRLGTAKYIANFIKRGSFRAD